MMQKLLSTLSDSFCGDYIQYDTALSVHTLLLPYSLELLELVDVWKLWATVLIIT